MRELKVFAGRRSRDLTAAICTHLGITPGQTDIFKFKNDNTFVSILENVREADVFVVQTSCPPVDDQFMELLILIDALRRASAGRITAVLPYYPYVRSDKKDQPRVPITAKLVADLITTAGAHRVLTLDLHAQQIQSFFNIPCDHLTAGPLLAEYFKAKQLPAPVAVATDAGSANKARTMARRLCCPLAVMDKQRVGNTDSVEMTAFIGDVKGRQCIIVEDEVSTGGTLAHAVRTLLDQGADEVYACATHGLFVGGAFDRLRTMGLREMVVTDTIPQDPAFVPENVRTLSVAPLLAESIRRVHSGDSISDLFQD